MSENPRVSVQKHFDMLVANQVSGSEMAGQGTAAPTINDLKLRRRFRVNTVHNVGNGFMDRQGYVQLNRNSLDGAITRALAEFTVNDNDFSAGAEIVIGPFTLIADLDFVVGGDTDLTAAAIADAIDNLPGFDGTAVGSDITVNGRKGAQGNADRFIPKGFGVVDNFTDITTFAENGSSTPALEGPEVV